MKSFNLKIVTPDGLVFDSAVESLLVRTDDGDVEFLAGHLSDPLDCSLPGSSIHGIFQARVLEWGAIAF